ncbi:MAG: glycosyltransferase [Halanaerobiales bacterium]|nr:glycosyltransferase [Halanaerobiales bacterium]
MNKKLASIIIITRDRLSYTKLCIQSILKKTVYNPYEIIVVDNDSTDGTVEYVTTLKKKNIIHKLILLKKNNGAGFAMNRGIEQAKGKYLIRSDNDMVYNHRWLSALVKALEQIPKSILQVAVFGELVEDGRRGGFSPENKINGIIIRKVNIGGCNMAFTLDTYLDLGPFPHVMCAEDGIYCFRAQQKGYIIGQIDNATGTHIDHPLCSLSKRYTDYAQYRIEILETLKKAGLEFWMEEDKEFYEAVHKGGKHGA